MTYLTATLLRRIFCHCALLFVVLLSVSALADNWQLRVGAQTGAPRIVRRVHRAAA